MGGTLFVPQVLLQLIHPCPWYTRFLHNEESITICLAVPNLQPGTLGPRTKTNELVVLRRDCSGSWICAYIAKKILDFLKALGITDKGQQAVLAVTLCQEVSCSLFQLKAFDQVDGVPNVIFKEPPKTLSLVLPELQDILA